MAIIPEPLRTEMAEAQQERDSAYWADKVREAIRAVPAYAVTPGFMAEVSACLSEKAGGLSPSMAELARYYLDDLSDDMRGFAS